MQGSSSPLPRISESAMRCWNCRLPWIIFGTGDNHCPFCNAVQK